MSGIQADLQWVFWLVGGINTVIVFAAFVNKPVRTWLFEKFKKPEEIQNAKIIKIEQQLDSQSRGIRVLLADRLHQSCLYFISHKCISVGDMENINAMYAEYKARGGNGLIKNMVERVRRLEITQGDRCYGTNDRFDNGNGPVNYTSEERKD